MGSDLKSRFSMRAVNIRLISATDPGFWSPVAVVSVVPFCDLRLLMLLAGDSARDDVETIDGLREKVELADVTGCIAAPWVYCAFGDFGGSGGGFDCRVGSVEVEEFGRFKWFVG